MADQKSSGRYHHVFVTTKGAEQKQALFVDLSAKELKTRFVRPYRRGRLVLVDGHKFDMKDISWVSIRASHEDAEATLKRLQLDHRRHIDELNRGGGLVFMGRFGWTNADLAEEGEDVKNDYITFPPGDMGPFLRFGSWVADNAGKAVVALLVGALAAWLGFKKG